jgi:hypothetical protein
VSDETFAYRISYEQPYLHPFGVERWIVCTPLSVNGRKTRHTVAFGLPVSPEALILFEEFWDMTTCNPLNVNSRLGVTFRSHL